MTRRQAIRAAAIAALNASPPAGVPEVGTRIGPFSPGALKAIRMRWWKEETKPVKNLRGPAVLHTLLAAFECYAVGDQEELEPLLAHVTDTLVGNRLGRLTLEVSEVAVEWFESGEADQDYRKAVLVLAIPYATERHDASRGIPSGS